MDYCNYVLDIRKPDKIEKRRGFQPPWYYAYGYLCPNCGKISWLRKNWHGIAPNGGFRCQHSIRGNKADLTTFDELASLK